MFHFIRQFGSSRSTSVLQLYKFATNIDLSKSPPLISLLPETGS